MPFQWVVPIINYWCLLYVFQFLEHVVTFLLQMVNLSLEVLNLFFIKNLHVLEVANTLTSAGEQGFGTLREHMELLLFTLAFIRWVVMVHKEIMINLFGRFTSFLFNLFRHNPFLVLLMIKLYLAARIFGVIIQLWNLLTVAVALSSSGFFEDAELVSAVVVTFKYVGAWLF